MVVLFLWGVGSDLLTVEYIWLTCPLVTPSCLCWAPLLKGQPPFSPPSSNGLPPASLKKLPCASDLFFFFQTLFTFTSAKGPFAPLSQFSLSVSLYLTLALSQRRPVRKCSRYPSLLVSPPIPLSRMVSLLSTPSTPPAGDLAFDPGRILILAGHGKSGKIIM